MSERARDMGGVVAVPMSTEYLRVDTEPMRALVRPEEESTGPVTAPAERLVCVVGVDMGKTFPLDAVTTIVGRHSADIELRATDVSRRHARLSRSRGSVIVEDLGSSNGTFVNDVAVESPVTLQVGDRLRFGTTTFVFTRHDELEERLRQLEKLDAMGALVKGLAHDFNNMLMVLQGGLEILSERVPIEDPDVQRMLDDMDKAATSASALVRRLLRIGRSKPGTLELVKMPVLIGDAVTMARNLKLDRVRISAQIVPDAMVRGSYEELKQVFLNLILNARDAMPKGGDITIKGAITTLDRSSALSLHLENEGKYIEIMVTDTGSGMDQATLARIFEPFFTTKAATKGSGLGLAMVYSSLRNHKGAIYAESTVGRGTTFRLLLPAVA